METIAVQWEDVQKLWDGYKKWKAVLVEIDWVRGANLPEGLSEAIVCLCAGAELIRSGHGDVQLSGGTIGEVKATSLPIGDADLSTFSPRAGFDKLFFVEILSDVDGTFLVYDLDMSRADVEKIMVNNSETFKQHADANRRPRFSIREEIIQKGSRQPTWQVDVPNAKVVSFA
jgi:hypothetical protein